MSHETPSPPLRKKPPEIRDRAVNGQTRKPVMVELGPGAEGQVSPDASWLAYIDQGQVVIERFPARAPRLIISSTGGGQPRWSRNGRQLFFISADKKLMAVEFDPVTVRAGVPRALSQTRIIEAAFVGHQYDVAPDGRFVVNAVTGTSKGCQQMSSTRRKPSVS